MLVFSAAVASRFHLIVGDLKVTHTRLHKCPEIHSLLLTMSAVDTFAPAQKVETRTDLVTTHLETLVHVR